jgi:hypothetical protein
LNALRREASVCVPDHRPELHDVEPATIQADALLPVQDRSALHQGDRDGNPGVERSEQDEREAAEGHVEESLHDQERGRPWSGDEGQDDGPVELLEEALGDG